ncbi:peptidase M1-like protein [Sediminihabitans luteus]|uniref:Aminopeptidase N n=1 Tax=Sediminihabitans luteus TaxID=1138585 RepID=A0A2M9CD63_9CELL|nr:M1 family metallopeptidase [Sediminihabitans luteus]PJJ69290.1 peptidase M1-like protein [Sediminihabitans luteus]GII98972.1 putative peptidase M1, membrane alanine aminopeptidase [Sediminihabitans luteus]
MPKHDATTPVLDPYVPERGSTVYRVEHYGLDLTYRVVANRLQGVATIEVLVLRASDVVVLDLVHLKASRVSVGGRRARFSQHGGKLTVRLGEVAQSGRRVTLEVTYGGSPRPVVGRWGDTGWEELTEGSLVASQPDGAPSWFPCNDHPSVKATFEITVTTDSPYTVVANGPLLGVTRKATTRVWRFGRTDPMCTYLASVNVGRYEPLELAAPAPGAVPQRAVLAREQHGAATADLRRHSEMMRVFERLFGPYPFDQYTLVVAEDDLEIPLEAQGLSIFGRNHIDGDGTWDRLVAHELAHQWFGNSVSVRRWQHIWLNEGFACYAEWLWSEESGRATADAHARAAHARLAALPQDLVVGDPGPDLMFDDRLYKRGALTLHALRLTIGHEPFFRVLRTWTVARRFGTATTADLRDVIVEQVPEHADAVDELLEQWLGRAALPALPEAVRR